MGRRLLTSWGLAVLLAVSVACDPGGSADAPSAGPTRSDEHLGPAASDTWPPFPDEAAVYVRKHLAGDLRAETGPDPRPYGFEAPIENVSFGRAVPTYALTRTFFDGKADGRRRLAFRETGTWMVPVLQNGELRGVAQVGRQERGPWGFVSIQGSPVMARVLEGLRSGDLLFYDAPRDATLLVRGSVVSELDVGSGRRVLDEPVPLSRFHEKLMAAYNSVAPVGPEETN